MYTRLLFVNECFSYVFFVNLFFVFLTGMLHIGVFDLNNEYECEFVLKGVLGMRLCHLRSGNKNNTGRRPLERTETKRTCIISPKSSMLSGVHDDC